MVKVFLDANILFAACATKRESASRVILKLVLTGSVTGVLSDYVVEEARRNLQVKAPDSFHLFPQLVDEDLYEIVNPDIDEVLEAAEYTTMKDAPVVAAAKKAKVNYLVSLDRKHLVDAPEVARGSGLSIVLPGELLDKLRE